MDVTLSPTTAARPSIPAEPGIAALVEALRDPACYPHPVDRVEVRETHISYVLLAGEFAYKLKKPVRLPFLDFSSPIARRHFCQEELRLNRRTAPQLYLSVECVGGEPRAPRIGDCHMPHEHAVKMRRFAQEALFSEMALGGRLAPAHVDALAAEIAAFHGSLAAGKPPRGMGTIEAVTTPALDNFRELLALANYGPPRSRLEALRRWTRDEIAARSPRFAQRRQDGYVRECHGDLHLANIVMLESRPVLFDGIEFGARYRWIDVMSDLAFTLMDLAHHRLEPLAWRLLDGYLERTGGYDGLDVLRFYMVYRALVRAKVACIRAHQAGLADHRRMDATAEFREYLQRADALTRRGRPLLVVMHGLPASGKTTVSQRLLEGLGAVRVRSDVERKRLHGLEPQARTGAGVGEGIYGARDSDRTYGRLAELARGILAAGYPAVVDATFLERGRRDQLRGLAQAAGAGFVIATCTAPANELRRRIAEREHRGGDASEAGAAVLDALLARVQPLAGREKEEAIAFDTSTEHWQAAADSFVRGVRAQAGG